MGPSPRIKELFDCYLRRELAPAEVAELVSLLGQAGAEEALTEPMQRLWEELKAKPMEYVVDWDRMYREVSRSEEKLSVLSKQRGGGSWRSGGRAVRRMEVWSWRAVAAVFLGLAGVAAYWSISYRRLVVVGVAVVPKSVMVKTEGMATVLAMSWQTAEDKKVIHLPDGSMVILNRHSVVEYRATGGNGGAGGGGGTGGTGLREVTLNGEAYFDIVHRPEQPFLVHTGKIVTRVLGTAFDIRAYSADKSIKVTVDHGKVQVLKEGANLGMLSDKEQMRFDRGTDSYRSQGVNLKPVMAWKPEEISFDDITMEEATRRIGGRFKMGFKFMNPTLKACRITATFYMEDDLDQIMTVICGVNQSKFAIVGSTVTIDGKGCN